MKWKWNNTPDSPKLESGLVKMIMMGKSIRQMWVNYRKVNKKAMIRNMWATTWQNQQNECVPSEISDQPGHPPSLIRVFAVRLKKAWVLSYPLSGQWTAKTDQAGWMPSLIWVFVGRTCHFVDFVTMRLIYNRIPHPARERNTKLMTA